MHSQSAVELKTYTTSYAILGLETDFVYIGTVILHWSSEESSLS